jgi:N-methylhydantoinase B
VHLGSTPLAVRAALDAVNMGRGDVVILNDPYAGGTHLPDVTLVAPVFTTRGRKPFAYVADRAHHADIGGGKPGSMALATDIHQEGLRLPPVHLMRAGQWVRETLTLFLANTRVPDERRGDLEAQLAALRAGAARTLDLVLRFGERDVARAMHEIQDYSERLVLGRIRRFPRGIHAAEDFLDDDGTGVRDIPVRVAIRRRAEVLEFDFRASGEQVRGPVNANLAITTSAVFYAIACVSGRDVPPNSGMMRPVRILTRPGSIVDCTFPSAVAGGNVETSQRLVDVLMRALAKALPQLVPAASGGTMNNLALGGWDSVRSRPFSYYETIGVGCGAGPHGDGASAMQTHMTNTWNTPVEVLEAYYPMRVHRYGVRRGSGGIGAHRGGDGIVRDVEVLVESDVTLLAERRKRGPWGLAGGEDGKPGADAIVDARGRRRRIDSKSSLTLAAGEHIVVATPGGGGWGKPPRKKKLRSGPARS